jgi:2-oxoglutarate dehydrogenase E1 component
MFRESSPLSAVSAGYIEDLYERFCSSPDGVDESWRSLFGVLDLASPNGSVGVKPAVTVGDGDRAALTEALRCWGHLSAQLNPLATLQALPHVETFAAHLPPQAPPLDILLALYCGSLAVETAHIDDPALRNWLIGRYEAAAVAPPPGDEVAMLRDLIRADTFEGFLARKFPTKKRFGAEGAEAIIVLLREVLRQAAIAGVTHVVIGTMHRGRLNLMATLLGRSMARLFAEIKGAHPFAVDTTRPGDVPYHLGDRTLVDTGAGVVEVTLLANPSHLEAVDPVALGRARALQDGFGADRVLPIILHTDAAVIGQGIVAEAVQLGGTAGFTTGGTVHIVINNQLGFTTEPSEARTSTYCTGAWKAVDSCILHLNGDDIAAASRAAQLAIGWRQTHARDAVIDFVCYRRNGHNEIDEPSFTQPLLYRRIAQQEPVVAITGRRLVEAGKITAAEIAAEAEACRAALAEAYDASPDYRTNESGYPAMPGGNAQPTGIDLDRLRAIANTLALEPEGMTLHPKMGRLLQQRTIGAEGIAWPMAEALAFGSLLLDGVHVRLTGQDVVRGAFSHRHFSLIDNLSGAKHIGLTNLPDAKGRFSLYNSPLSEYAVLGFEYGYSVERLDALTIWEAQFGDFANGAQIILDQFISAAEEKWCTPSGLVVLLPHGLEGQGPEHSSARLERFLQMTAGTNMRIVNPSTPANYFHLLRRQVCAPERRPMIVMSPKRLLRLPAAVSPLADFAPTRSFEPLVTSATGEAIDHVLLCSGKIAYDLEAERTSRQAANVAIIRIEELFPLPAEALTELFRRWPDAACVWVQEEPANMGAWSWLDRRIERLRRDAGALQPTMLYAGRAESGSPAGSFHGDHEADQVAIVARAFEGTA